MYKYHVKYRMSVNKKAEAKKILQDKYVTINMISFKTLVHTL